MKCENDSHSHVIFLAMDIIKWSIICQDFGISFIIAIQAISLDKAHKQT